jgi:Ca2+-transporting ATPase
MDLAAPAILGRRAIIHSEKTLGLCSQEAADRLAEFGPNTLPQATGRGLGRIVGETLQEPMFLLLIGATALYLVMGALGEGLFLAAGATASIGLVIFQEARAERALAALRDLAQPSAHVIRDGVVSLVQASRLVPGDVIMVSEGDRIPADGLLIAGDMLRVDESTLTGEAAPVTKRLATAEDVSCDTQAIAPDPSPLLFAGTLIVQGQATAQVSRTGAKSALGQIGASLAAIDRTPTPLQRTAGRLVAILGVFAIGFCAVVALAYGVFRNDWIGGALAGVTVAIALIPEEFPMVLAIFLALGAWRLAGQRVLVRRSAVTESLGAVSALCVDKTGTLTSNRMEVARIWTPTGAADMRNGDAVAPDANRALSIAALACAERATDPMDRAIHAANQAGAGYDLVRTWPLRADRLAMMQCWRRADSDFVTVAKGSPEAIFDLAHLAAPQIAALHAVIEQFAVDGLRVLGVAQRVSTAPPQEDPATGPFQFVGLIGFLDPIRPDAPIALAQARSAGVKVYMITGDHPATALAIARAAGIDTTAGVLLGTEIASMPFPSLRARLRDVRVFARVRPEQKLLLVEALKADGEIVAMTGDGVNDAPALEAADIGIAMGKRGADVAREAADIILLDDGFAAIIAGIALGRRIFTNLRKALTYITAIHVPIAGLALAPILMGFPPLLLPMHVVLLELAIDPICALAFEGEPSADDAMKRRPRRPMEPLFGPKQISVSLLQGGVVFLGVFGIYAWSLSVAPAPQARGAAFLTLVAAILTLALVDAMGARGQVFAPHRKAYWVIAALLTLAMTAIFSVPPVAAMFRVDLPDGLILAVAAATAFVSGAWYWALSRIIAFAKD